MTELLVPLFSRTELASAFGLLMPPDEADALAARWFAEFADWTDQWGRYVIAGGWGERPPLTPGEEPFDDRSPDTQDHADRCAANALLFCNETPAGLERLLLRVGDLHLGLFASVSEETFERMRLVRRMSRRGAERNRLQMRRSVDEWRAQWLTEDGRGWRRAE